MPTIRLYNAAKARRDAQAIYDTMTRNNWGPPKRLSHNGELMRNLIQANAEHREAMEEARLIVEAPNDQARAVAIRIAGEQDIARFLVKSLLEQGFELQADDNNDELMEFNNDPALILETLFDVDMCSLNVFHPEHMVDQGWILLVFGNSPPELIADHTTKLDKFLVPTWKYIRSYYDPQFVVEEAP